MVCCSSVTQVTRTSRNISFLPKKLNLHEMTAKIPPCDKGNRQTAGKVSRRATAFQHAPHHRQIMVKRRHIEARHLALVVTSPDKKNLVKMRVLLE